jgi:hypothetical protein
MSAEVKNEWSYTFTPPYFMTQTVANATLLPHVMQYRRTFLFCWLRVKKEYEDCQVQCLDLAHFCTTNDNYKSPLHLGP